MSEAFSKDSFDALWATPARDVFSATCALGYVAVTTICYDELAVLPWLGTTLLGVSAAAVLGSRWAKQDREHAQSAEPAAFAGQAE